MNSRHSPSLSIAVVHLIRRGNDPALFERFIASYRRHDSGLPHRLVLLFKGFEDNIPPPGVSQLLDGLLYTPLFVSDEGFDVTAYVKCAKAMGEEVAHLLFLNSHAEILADDWLGNLHAPFVEPDVGATGATGSWQTNFSGIFHWGYTVLMLIEQNFSRSNRMGIFARLGTSIYDALKQSSTKHYLQNPFYFYRNFRRFPNPHLRTNGFMVRKDIFIAAAGTPITTKRKAYVFESGRSGLSLQLMRRGLRLLVVDKQGKTYEARDWHASNTFWTGDQANLLIGDNQTRHYQSGSAEERQMLETAAWGWGENKGKLEAFISRDGRRAFGGR